MPACQIRQCDAAATARITLERPESDRARADYADTGRWTMDYCAAHAVDRPSARGIERYGDRWTIGPIP